MTTNTNEPKSNTVRKLIALKPQYDAAKSAADAARVPDDDLPVRGDEPVTTSGWYQGTTKSGRTAWVHYQWNNGRCRDSRPTYDLAAECEVTRLAVQYGALCMDADCDPELQQEARAFGIEV
jgi:hypothetical protein